VVVVLVGAQIVCRQSGYDHDKSYNDDNARKSVLDAILRIIEPAVMTCRGSLGGQNDPGDATVPGYSGIAPKSSTKFFAEMEGFEHQGAYEHSSVRAITLYSILHLAAESKPLE